MTTTDNSPICPACGYQLRGLRSDSCPECGRAVADAVSMRQTRDLQRRLSRRSIIMAVIVFIATVIAFPDLGFDGIICFGLTFGAGLIVCIGFPRVAGLFPPLIWTSTCGWIVTPILVVIPLRAAAGFLVQSGVDNAAAADAMMCIWWAATISALLIWSWSLYRVMKQTEIATRGQVGLIDGVLAVSLGAFLYFLSGVVGWMPMALFLD